MAFSAGLTDYVAGEVGNLLSGAGAGETKKKAKKKRRKSLPLSYLFDGAETGGCLVSSTQGSTTEAVGGSNGAAVLNERNRHQVAAIVKSPATSQGSDVRERSITSLSEKRRTKGGDAGDSDNEMERHKVTHKARRRKNDFKTDPERDRRTIFIGNLPLSFKKKQLLRLCSEFGQVSSVRFRSVSVADGTKSRRLSVMKKEFADTRQGQNAYAVFCEEGAAQRALALHNRVIDERHISVDIASNSMRDYKRSVFVGNLLRDIQEEVVREFFERTCGAVDRVRLIRDSKTGEGKGFGYVWFVERETVLLALNCHGEELKGRAMRVFRAKNPLNKAGPPSSYIGCGKGGKSPSVSGLLSTKGQVSKSFHSSMRSPASQKKGMPKGKNAKGKRPFRKGKQAFPKGQRGHPKTKVQGRPSKKAKSNA